MAVEFLRQLPIFRTLSDGELSTLAAHAQRRAARRGELLAAEDEHGIFYVMPPRSDRDGMPHRAPIWALRDVDYIHL
jgi:hypothetical protein